ncbi:hypothetical protein AB0D59_26515 [Streptomyces sp. NPDC048417]|uniref:hypothetical protein n=1 Tax=Streptomyces sp. NPDC048417 TaxID=3155387 RepID=UPI0034450022
MRERGAAALVRFDGRTFADLATRAESDPAVLDELSISAVGPQANGRRRCSPWSAASCCPPACSARWPTSRT